MSILESSSFRRLLDKRLSKVSDDRMEFNELNSMIPKLFNEMTSESAYDEFMSVTGVPDIPEFNGQLTSLTMGPGWLKRIETKEYAAQIVAQRKLLDDKKFNVLEDFASGLMDSFYRVKEKKAVNVFNNATSIAFDFMTINEEGKPLASTTHLTRIPGVSTSTGFSNYGTGALNKTNVAAGRIAMRQYRTDIGERYQPGESLALLVPDNLEFKALELVGTEKGLDSAEGTKNVHQNRYQVIVYPRMSDASTTAWALVDMTMMKRYLLFVNRVIPETKRMVSDWATYAYMQAIYGRFACGWLNWRFIYWNAP